MRKGAHHSHNNHHHHQQQPHRQKPHPKWNKKSSAKNIIPKNMLKFPEHLPVHILDVDINEMDSDDDEMQYQQQQTVRPLASISSVATSVSPSLTSSTGSIDDAVPKVVLTSTMTAPVPPANILNANVEGIILNDRATSVPVYGGHSGGDISSQSSVMGNNTVKPVILVDDKSILVDESNAKTGTDDEDSDGGTEKGYYEKTIINKNGVFIENIRKITNIDQRILGTSESKESATIAVDDQDDINRKRIELMNGAPVAHAQHYVITSSGTIEKTDTLPNDDLVAQFPGGLTNSKSFNANRGYNRGQEEEEQQQEPNGVNNEPLAVSDDGIAATTTTTSEASGAATRQSVDTVSPSATSTATISTVTGAGSNNCIVMGKSPLLLIHISHTIIDSISFQFLLFLYIYQYIHAQHVVVTANLL